MTITVNLSIDRETKERKLRTGKTYEQIFLLGLEQAEKQANKKQKQAA